MKFFSDQQTHTERVGESKSVNKNNDLTGQNSAKNRGKREKKTTNPPKERRRRRKMLKRTGPVCVTIDQLEAAHIIRRYFIDDGDNDDDDDNNSNNSPMLFIWSME